MADIKIGDLVRVIKQAPETLPDESRVLWNACVGKIFPVTEVDENGLVEIEVSRREERDAEGGRTFIFDCLYLGPDEFELVIKP
jgi:hypothetical protein